MKEKCNPRRVGAHLPGERKQAMNATKTKLGLLGAMVFSMIALPTYGAPPAGRNHDPRGRQGSIDSRGRGRRVDSRHVDRRDIGPGRRDSRKDVNVRIRIGPGPVLARRPAPVRYEIRTETVLVEPAHYEIRTERVLVMEGHWEERVIPGRREFLRDSRGNLHEVQATPDRVERTWCPPVYETRIVKVLVPARYETRTVRVPVTDRWDGRYDTRTSVAGSAIGAGLQILGQILNR